MARFAAAKLHPVTPVALPDDVPLKSAEARCVKNDRGIDQTLNLAGDFRAHRRDIRNHAVSFLLGRDVDDLARNPDGNASKATAFGRYWSRRVSGSAAPAATKPV